MAWKDNKRTRIGLERFEGTGTKGSGGYADHFTSPPALWASHFWVRKCRCLTCVDGVYVSVDGTGKRHAYRTQRRRTNCGNALPYRTLNDAGISVMIAGAANSKRKRKRRHNGVRGLTAEMEIEWQCVNDTKIYGRTHCPFGIERLIFDLMSLKVLRPLNCLLGL
jgi:hypothetical protein